MNSMIDDYALEDQKAEFDSVVQSLNEGLVLADADGYIRFANDRFSEITGYSNHEILGKKIYDVFFPPGSPESVQEKMLMTERYKARQSGISEVYETHILRKDGQRRWIETKAGPLYNRNGHIVGSIGANSDITERKQLEDQLRWSQKMEAVGRLAGGVAHDFNNLLTVIQGYATLLRQQLPATDPGSRKVNVILEASEAASTLTQQLLTISRRQVVQMRLLSLNSIVEQSIHIIQGITGEQIKLTVDLMDDLPLIRGDHSQLQQILLNLIVNARDAMPEGGNLLVTTDLTDREGSYPTKVEKQLFVRLRVEDTGHGMDAATMSRIFEPFFTTKRKGRGTGLGLSVTFGIVEEHNGVVKVSSEPDQGATFDILFPAITDSPLGYQPRREWRSHTGSEKILLVEDNYAVRILIKESLEKYGYTVYVAEDGYAALEFSKGTNFSEISLLITDLIMPKMNGLEVAGELLKLKSDLRVIVISGYPDEPLLWEKLKECGYSFLPKPFGPEDLVRLVRSNLDGSEEKELLL